MFHGRLLLAHLATLCLRTRPQHHNRIIHHFRLMPAPTAPRPRSHRRNIRFLTLSGSSRLTSRLHLLATSTRSRTLFAPAVGPGGLHLATRLRRTCTLRHSMVQARGMRRIRSTGRATNQGSSGKRKYQARNVCAHCLARKSGKRSETSLIHHHGEAFHKVVAENREPPSSFRLAARRPKK